MSTGRSLIYTEQAVLSTLIITVHRTIAGDGIVLSVPLWENSCFSQSELIRKYCLSSKTLIQLMQQRWNRTYYLCPVRTVFEVKLA